MRLIDNYLSAVAGYLPRESREDIQAELRSSLYEQLEEQSERLQRELTEQEQAEFLKKIGNPLKVASEYSPHRYLIGPTLFPYYMQALKGLAVVVAIFYVALAIVVAVASGEWIESMNDITGKFLRTLLTTGAFVTLGFALVDRSHIKTDWFENWNPLSLLDRDEFLAVKKGDLSFDVVAEIALLLWWNGAFSLPAQVAWNESTLVLSRGTVFDLVFWPVNVLLTTSLLLSIAVMWSGYWRRATVYLRLFIESISGVIVAFLLRSSELVLFESTGSAEIERVLPVMVMILRGLLWIVFVMILWELVKYGRIALRLGKLKD